jgi:hypothetical protein
MFAALLLWQRLPPRSRAVLIALPVLFLLALGSKESAVMLPALLILFDAAGGRLRRDRWREWLRERIAPLSALALVLVGYVLVRVAVLGVFAPASLNPIMAADPAQATRLRSALQIWPEIARLLTVPACCWRSAHSTSPPSPWPSPLLWLSTGSAHKTRSGALSRSPCLSSSVCCLECAR